MREREREENQLAPIAIKAVQKFAEVEKFFKLWQRVHRFSESCLQWFVVIHSISELNENKFSWVC